MSTESQISANRLNAQKSTGPKSPEGKAKVSQNAVTHGLTAQRPVLSNENPEEYAQFRDDFFRHHAPVGIFEEFLVQRAADTFWRLQRASTFETLITNSLLGQAIDAVNQNIAGDPNFRLADVTPQDYLAVAIENDFSKEQTLERIQRYELRIENSHYRTLRELRKLQSQRLQQTEGKQGLVRSADKQVVPVPAFPAQNKQDSAISQNKPTSHLRSNETARKLHNKPNRIRPPDQNHDEKQQFLSAGQKSRIVSTDKSIDKECVG